MGPYKFACSVCARDLDKNELFLEERGMCNMMTKLKELREEFEKHAVLCWEVSGLNLRDNLAEKIEESMTKLEAVLKTVEDEQRWIPVGKSQDYPKNCDPILVVTKKKTILVARYLREGDLEKIKWEADYIPSDAFYEIDDHQKLFWRILGVTHWRPLPEGPRKKEEQE